MRAMGLALLITLVAFAGCMGGGDGDDNTPTATATGSATPTGTQSSTGSPSQTQTDTGTSDPEPEENTPPTASLSASIEQGEVPVDVTFTLDGSDADGDELTWTFDADGDGTFEAEGTSADLPATYEHSYPEAGNYTATLTVTDGVAQTAESVSIDATAAAEGQVGFTTWTASGTAQTSCPGCLPASGGEDPVPSIPPACVGLAADSNEADCVFFELPDGAVGQTATIIGDGVDGTWAEYAMMSECSPAGDVLATAAGYDGLTVVVPEGATCVVMFDSFLPGTTFTITVG